MIAQDVAGRYDLEYELTSDVVSTVYQALDRRERRLVALRLFSAAVCAGEGAASTIIAWAQATAALEHPNISRIIAWGTADGRVYVTSELAPGGSLRSLLASSERLSPDRAVAISAGILGALQAAHDVGITHGGLRPSQILFGPNGEVKVSDFGLRSTMRSAGIDEQTGVPSTDAPIGSAPAGDGEPEDVRQAAAILYEMLVGRPPLRSTPRQANLATSPRLANPRVPAWLDRVVVRALSRDPAQCYLHAAALRVALEPPAPPIGPRPSEARHQNRSLLVNIASVASRGIGRVFILLLPAVAAGLVVAIVATVFLVGRVVLSGPVTDLAVVETPSFVGESFEQATARAAALGVNVARNSERPTDDQPRDTILSQWPAPGASLRRGSTIRLAVSSGLRAPNVVGQPLEAARQELASRGWPIGPIENNPTFWVDPNKVVQQTPGADEIVADRTPLRLSVAVIPPDVALDHPVRASAGANVQAVVDDKLDTAWSAQSAAPAWIEIDLGGARTVQRVELVVSMKPEGWAGHEIWFIDAKGEEQKVWTFGGEYKDGQVLTKQFTPGVSNVAKVRIRTSGSIAVPAWKEIRVY